MHQSPQGRAPVAQMVFSPLPGLFAESTSYPSRSHLGNASPAQATRPLAATAGARDDDTEDEASNTPRRLSGPKRRLLSQPDASLGTRKSTKRRHISESPEQCNNMPPTVAGEEDSDTLLVPRSRRKRRSSTFAASKVSHHIWNLSTSSSDTSPSGLSDDGTSESETLVQRKNPYARSSLSNNTAHCALDTLLPTPTLDFDTARRIDNPRAHPSTGTKVDDSNHSQVHPFACPPNSNASTRARTEQPSPAVKLRINIFVDASCGSHVDIKKWPDGRFKDKTPCAIFDQVSALIIRNDVKSIKLELKTLKKEHELNSIIERDDDVEAFEMILRKFNGRIRERKDAGETEFKMLLKPEFEQQGAAEADVAQGSKSDEDYL